MDPFKEDYKEHFLQIIDDVPKYIQYKGITESNLSSAILKDYYFLLFPTYYPGEGFAGTLIDAFSSGLPVIATDWMYNSEIIKNGFNGYLFSPNNLDELVTLLDNVIISDNYNDLKKKLYY